MKKNTYPILDFGEILNRSQLKQVTGGNPAACTAYCYCPNGGLSYSVSISGCESGCEAQEFWGTICVNPEEGQALCVDHQYHCWQP